MTSKADKREEGLRALARMMAAAYRRRMTGETGIATSLNSGAKHPDIRAKTAQYTEPEDLRQEGSYTETVKVENFRRRKANHVSIRKIAEQPNK